MDSIDVEYIDSHLCDGEDGQEEEEEESLRSIPRDVPNYADTMYHSTIPSSLLCPYQYTPDPQDNYGFSNPAPSVSQDNSLPPLYTPSTIFHDFSQDYSGSMLPSSLPFSDPFPVEEYPALSSLQSDSNSLQSHERSQDMDIEFIPESNQEEEQLLRRKLQIIRQIQIYSNQIQQFVNNINTRSNQFEQLSNMNEERRRNRLANLYVFYSNKKKFRCRADNDVEFISSTSAPRPSPQQSQQPSSYIDLTVNENVPVIQANTSNPTVQQAIESTNNEESYVPLPLD